jgi:hypothetical protein
MRLTQPFATGLAVGVLAIGGAGTAVACTGGQNDGSDAAPTGTTTTATTTPTTTSLPAATTTSTTTATTTAKRRLHRARVHHARRS